MRVFFLVLCLLFSPAAAVAEADTGPFKVTVLPFSATDATVEDVTSGRLDGEFTTFDLPRDAQSRRAVLAAPRAARRH